MAQLRQDYREFINRNTEVIAVGPEDAKEFSKYWRAEKMPFPGIPDPEHIIAKLFGQKVNYLKMGRMPAQIIIDREGKIRYSHYGTSMSDITANAEILSILDDLNKEN
jgi:peroxiredoxin